MIFVFLQTICWVFHSIGELCGISKLTTLSVGRVLTVYISLGNFFQYCHTCMWLSSIVPEKCSKAMNPKCSLLRQTAKEIMLYPQINQVTLLYMFKSGKTCHGKKKIQIKKILKNFIQNKGNKVNGKSPFLSLQWVYSSSLPNTKAPKIKEVNRLLPWNWLNWWN